MIAGLPVYEWRNMAQLRNLDGDSVEKGRGGLVPVSWAMWVARNDLVHRDHGEI